MVFQYRLGADGKQESGYSLGFELIELNLRGHGFSFSVWR